jgi:cytochrome P450
MTSFLLPEIRRNPYPLYDQMRSAAPVVRDPATGLWMLFDHESVKRALNDHDTFSSAVTRGQAAKWLVFIDPPRHVKLRALVMRAFMPKSVAALETRIREISRKLLNDCISAGEFDLVAGFSLPLPMMVVGDMLGIPSSDWVRFREWSDIILDLSYSVAGGVAGEKATQAFRVVTAEMAAYLAALLDERRATPKDDLLTRLVQAEVDGERLTDDDILGFFQLLLVAGHETTTNLINNAVLCLLEHRDQLDHLVARPDLVPSAIEEVLRYRSPLQWVMRGVRQEVELRGQTIPVGAMVLPLIGSANRDAAVFPEPGRFDITRDPNPQIAFGHGIHFCLGAPLSRLEGRIALGDLLEHLPDLEVADTAPWEPRKALHVHGPAKLVVRLKLR